MTAFSFSDGPCDWLVPDWPAPAHVRALCTTRRGGHSTAPFDSLNLGDHVGDAPEAVAANRRRLQAHMADTTLGARAVFLQQVHGTHVLDLDLDMDANAVHGAADLPGADACVASRPGRVCTVMVADCLPVLLTNRQGSVVAAAHAGWRGLAGAPLQGGLPPEPTAGVLEAVLQRFWHLAQAQLAPGAMKIEADAAPALWAADTLAWLGPCIGPRFFEVGAEVRAAFCQHSAQAARHFQPTGPAGSGKYLADLAALARQRLHAAGVVQVYGNDSSAGWCTVGNPSRFFSHRRDSLQLGGSGRFAACIWRS